MTNTPDAVARGPVRVLAAGDHFVLNNLLTEQLASRVEVELEVSEIVLPWPHEPFQAVAEVDEASGSEDQLIEALQGVSACVTQMAPLTARVLESCPDLSLFAVSRGGPVNANLEAATEHGVAVTFAPGRNATATAEYTIAMMLAAMRRIPDSHGGLVEGQWKGELYAYDATGLELEGTTVGLVGCGAIGVRVARVLAGFGADVVVYDPYADPGALPAGTRVVGLEELLQSSRVVSLHARVTEESKGIIGAEQLASMPAGSVVVNCARGALLDYDALARSLTSGHTFAAALDVFDVEPLPADSLLRSAPNVVMTPHLAGASQAVAQRAARIVADEVARWTRGETPQHCANPAVLSGR